MSAANQLQFFSEIEKLKHLDRKGWVLCNINKPESVAGHMYRMAIMAMSLEPIDGCDMNKIVQMALVHDIAECRVGDITPHDNVPADVKAEKEMTAMKDLTSALPNGMKTKFMSVFVEYEDRETPESKVTKDLDIYDLVQQAFEYEKSEFHRTHKLPSLSEFFEPRVYSRIQTTEILSWLNELLSQRNLFHSEISNGALLSGKETNV